MQCLQYNKLLTHLHREDGRPVIRRVLVHDVLAVRVLRGELTGPDMTYTRLLSCSASLREAKKYLAVLYSDNSYDTMFPHSSMVPHMIGRLQDRKFLVSCTLSRQTYQCWPLLNTLFFPAPC